MAREAARVGAVVELDAHHAAAHGEARQRELADVRDEVLADGVDRTRTGTSSGSGCAGPPAALSARRSQMARS